MMFITKTTVPSTRSLLLVKVSFGRSKVFGGESISTDCLAYFKTVKDNAKTKHTDLLGSECEGCFISFSVFRFKKRAKSWTVARPWENLSFEHPADCNANRPMDATGCIHSWENSTVGSCSGWMWFIDSIMNFAQIRINLKASVIPLP